MTSVREFRYWERKSRVTIIPASLLLPSTSPWLVSTSLSNLLQCLHGHSDAGIPIPQVSDVEMCLKYKSVEDTKRYNVMKDWKKPLSSPKFLPSAKKFDGSSEASSLLPQIFHNYFIYTFPRHAVVADEKGATTRQAV